MLIFPIIMVACAGVILYLGYDKVRQIEDYCIRLEREVDSKTQKEMSFSEDRIRKMLEEIMEQES